MNEHRYHRGPADPLAGPRRFVRRAHQPPVHRTASAIEDKERGELDLRKLCAAALAQLEAMHAKQRAKAAAATLAEADWRETARRAAPAIARLRGQEGAGTPP